jgi:transposase
MRKSFNGLAGLVRDHLGDEPMSGHLFVFVGRRADKLKVLWWDHHGWALFYKRLERGTFRLPEARSGDARVEIQAADLGMILDGIDLRNTRRRRRWTPPREARENEPGAPEIA